MCETVKSSRPDDRVCITCGSELILCDCSCCKMEKCLFGVPLGCFVMCSKCDKDFTVSEFLRLTRGVGRVCPAGLPFGYARLP